MFFRLLTRARGGERVRVLGMSGRRGGRGVGKKGGVGVGEEGGGGGWGGEGTKVFCLSGGGCWLVWGRGWWRWGLG
jgi:hypothetical protein